MQRKFIHRLILPALLLCISNMGLASTAVTHPATPATSDAPTNGDLAETACAIGEEKFLPADYYYCIATQAYGQQHYERARKFFTTAASWASKPAQYVLGIMAFNGDHQPVDRALAMAWLSLASERPQSPFRKVYAAAAANTTPAEQQAAEKLLANMRPTYADTTAAIRAERRYAQGMATLARLNSSGGQYCMGGISTPTDPGTLPDPTQCPPIAAITKTLDATAANVFDGWNGQVTVGPLQQVAAPAPTTRKPK